jgi:hypothetical protein
MELPLKEIAEGTIVLPLIIIGLDPARHIQ